MVEKRFKEFIRCHEGVLNRILHILGFSLIGLGIWEKSFSFVIVGAGTQELSHFYQYAKTKNIKDSPLYCLKSQVLFVYPILFLILVYIWIAR